MTSGPLRLRITAEASNLAVARTFIGTALRVLERPESVIDDLRLAVSELLTVLVRENQGPIGLELTISEHDLQVTVTGPTTLPPLPADITKMVGMLAHDGLELSDSSWVIRVSRE